MNEEVKVEPIPRDDNVPLTSHKLSQPHSCPHCAAVFDATTHTRTDATTGPRPGDISLCTQCFEYFVFVDLVTTRKLEQSDIDQIEAQYPGKYAEMREMQRHLSARAKQRAGFVMELPPVRIDRAMQFLRMHVRYEYLLRRFTLATTLRKRRKWGRRTNKLGVKIQRRFTNAEIVWCLTA